MLKKLFFVLLLAGLMAVPGTALADYDTGDYELILSGSGTSDDDLDNTTISAEATLGYFFTPVLEGVIRQGIGVSDTEDDSNWSGSTRLGLDYNFPLNNVVPYLGANVGYLYGDDVNETWIAGPGAGVKTFVNTTTFILVAAEYDFTFDDADEVDEAFDDGRFVYTLGVGFKW